MKKTWILALTVTILVHLWGCMTGEWHIGPGPNKQLKLPFEIIGLKDTLIANKDTITLKCHLVQPLTFFKKTTAKNEDIQVPLYATPEFFFFLSKMTEPTPNSYRLKNAWGDDIKGFVINGEKAQIGSVHSFLATDIDVIYEMKLVPMREGLYIGEFNPSSVNSKELFYETFPYIINKEKNHAMINSNMKYSTVIMGTPYDESSTFAFYVKK